MPTILIPTYLIYSNRQVCGNGIVEEGETSETCCMDVGCLGEQFCQENACKSPVCGECEYLEEYSCKSYACCKDSDCDDNDENTANKCENSKSKESKCVYHPKGDFAIIESDTPFNQESKVFDKFYKTYNDEYDFLILYTDFDYPGNIHASPTGLKPIGGIGRTNYAELEGFSNNLRSTASLGDISNKFEGIIEEFFPTNANGILHEIGHYWCCFVNYQDDNGIRSNNLLQGSVHWHDQLLDVGTNDPMGGRYLWTETSPGVFRGTSRDHAGGDGHYSDFTLYLMGLLPKEEVEPVKLVVPQSELTFEGNDLIVSGEMKLIEIEDIISVEGERNPIYGESQKDFKAGFILWTKDKSKVSSNTKEKMNQMREIFERQWVEATRGLSTISTDL